MIREHYTLGKPGAKCQTFDEKYIHSYAILLLSAVISASDSAEALNCMISVQKKLNKTHVHRCGHSLSLQINKSLQSC